MFFSKIRKVNIINSLNKFEYLLSYLNLFIIYITMKTKLNTDLLNIIKTLQTEKCICLLAPSFVVDYKYPDILYDLKGIGFDKIVELTYSAKLISHKYHDEIKKSIKKKDHKQFICANCPTIITLIENKYPAHKDKLSDIASPMVVMGRYLKKEYPKHKTIFIGPCLAKKQEAEKNKKDINFALTFFELAKIVNYTKKNKLFKPIKKTNNIDFDKVYNDYTKIYPLSGAVAETMHSKSILTPEEVLVIDGPKNIDWTIKELEKNKKIKFIDILFCKGGCIGGPGIISKDSQQDKEDKIIKDRETCKKTAMKEHKGKFKDAKRLNLKRKK